MVYVIIAVYNEEKVILPKLESVVNSDYPKSKLQIVVASDASTDNTDDIVRSFAKQNQNTSFFRFDIRAGKANTLNQIYSKLKPKIKEGDVFIFTDANVLLTPTTIFHLCKYFVDERIAQVGAKVINKGMQVKGISFQERFYISNENQIKFLEGKIFGAMMGAFGACFAHRANLYRKIPQNHVVDDFYLTLRMIDEGYQCILSLEAECYEDLPHDMRIEYNRKKRISTGNFQNLSYFWKLLIPTRPQISFCFWGHKVLRWLTPIFMIIAIVSLVVLCPISKLYTILCYVMFISFAIPLLDLSLQKLNLHIPLFRYISYFYSMNIALIEGMINHFKGKKQNIWQPTDRL